MRRKQFIASGASVVAATSLPVRGSATPPRVRLEVTEFQQDSGLVRSLSDAVGQMIQNQDSTDPKSWLYWFYSHWTPPGVKTPPSMEPVFRKCKHHMKYFLWLASRLHVFL